MTIETLAAFMAASAALLLIPGPTTLLVASYALGQGWRATLPMAVGVALGDVTGMAVSLLGLGAALAASAALFTAVKWAGAAYLIYLGVRLWRAGAIVDVEARQGRAPALRMVAHAWMVTALNPKGIVFFVAFLPLFINPDASFLPQVALLVGTFVALSFMNVLAYALVAARARRLVRSPRAMRTVNRVGGGILIAAGVAATTARASR